MSIYKSAFSGAQMDDTFDKVQNKKITAADVGAVPTERQINGKALSGDISLAASDVGARRSDSTGRKWNSYDYKGQYCSRLIRVYRRKYGVLRFFLAIDRGQF